MSPSLLAILLHIGKIMQAIRDVEKTVADMVEKKDITADRKAAQGDLADLLESGLIPLPFPSDVIKSVAEELRNL